MSPANLLNLNSLMSSEPASFTNDFAPPMMDKFRYEGDLYGLPLTSQVQMMAYNADLLGRRGLSVPKNDWTFDEFVELASAAASTNSSDPSYGYLFSTYDEFFFLGREVRWADLQANPAKVYFDSPEMLAHLRWIASLKDNGTLFLQDDNWQEMEKLMTGGQLAFWSAMMGEKNSYFYMPGQEPPYKIGMVPLPEVEGENPMSGWSNDRGQYISAQSNEAQACWDWIKFLSDKPDLFSGVPARRSMAESPAWEASVGREEAAAYRAAIALAKPAEQVDIQAQQPLWPLYNWRGEAVDAAFKGLDLPPLLQVLQQKAENYLACSLTIDTSMPSEELHQSILDCAKQADPEGKWWR
jgi:ABC-type glycerol-3-phosphate transport system substrate-binding protein